MPASDSFGRDWAARAARAAVLDGTVYIWPFTCAFVSDLVGR